jgi:ribose 5-phosphate isomerase B
VPHVENDAVAGKFSSTGLNELELGQVTARECAVERPARTRKSHARTTFDSSDGEHLHMKIALGADHAGFADKDLIVQLLRNEGFEVIDYGTHDATPVDYPQYGYAVGEAVATGRAERGIVVCGSSLGIAMAANKVPGIRCAPVAEPLSAELARRHNDANVLALSERLSGWEMIERCVRVFLETSFDGGRHAHRTAQLFEFDDAQRARTLKAIEQGAVTGAQTPKELL